VDLVITLFAIGFEYHTDRGSRYLCIPSNYKWEEDDTKEQQQEPFVSKLCLHQPVHFLDLLEIHSALQRYIAAVMIHI